MPKPLESAKARVLVLTSDKAQRELVRSALCEVSELLFFPDPHTALAKISVDPFEAVVVDVNVPPTDFFNGIWFLQELRKIKADVGVIVRSTDENIVVARAAIDARAIQLIIKNSPNERAMLRQSVDTAVRESQERRRQTDALEAAQGLHTRHKTTLNRLNDEITKSDLCLGFVQGLRNQVAAVTGFSDLLRDHPAANDTATAEIFSKLISTASRLDDHVNRFLRAPFMEQNLGVFGVNDCLDSLGQIFRLHPLFNGASCTFESRGILPDRRCSANPNRLLVGLRHLVEYCAIQTDEVGSSVRAAANYCKNARADIAKNRSGFTLNKQWAPSDECAVLSISANCGKLDSKQLEEKFTRNREESLMGNLLVLGTELAEDRLALDVTRSRTGITSFNVYLPLTV